ncbi:MAG: serine/threonine protein kinase, partial [Myxococcales bacterium]|nr:serine/threonine protein kinase [Myxococcales bacterium]
VVAVHDVGLHEGRVFVAMEFVDGGTLGDWMSKGPSGAPQPWRESLEILLAAGSGLAAAHAAGLV